MQSKITKTKKNNSTELLEPDLTLKTDFDDGFIELMKLLN